MIDRRFRPFWTGLRWRAISLRVEHAVAHGRLIVTLIPETNELLRRITLTSTSVAPLARCEER